MNEEESGHCHHIEQLPPVPTIEKLSVLRRGLRKQKLPEFAPGWQGGHEQIGEFNILSASSGLTVEWKMVDGPQKKFRLDDLCKNPKLELDRLEFGWMIANMAKLDGIHEIDMIADLKYAMKLLNQHSKLEQRWRHWAIVPAGHMLF